MRSKLHKHLLTPGLYLESDKKGGYGVLGVSAARDVNQSLTAARAAAGEKMHFATPTE